MHKSKSSTVVESSYVKEAQSMGKDTGQVMRLRRRPQAADGSGKLLAMSKNSHACTFSRRNEVFT